MRGEFKFVRFMGFDQESVEIGTCSKFEMRDLKHDVYEYRPDGTVLDNILRVYDWKTPVPMNVGPLQVGPAPSEQVVKDLRTIIGCLVHQLGGSAIINSAEYNRSDPRKLTTEFQHLPGFMILTTEDD